MSDVDWDNLVQDLGPRLLRYFAVHFPRPLASDLVQETLIRLVQKVRLGAFIEERGTLKNLAFGIARNIRLEALKSKERFVLVENERELDRAVEKFDSEDDLAHLRWAISKLKPIEQEIILLMIDQENQIEEIADLMAMPVGTVKSHIHRAKSELKQIMEASL